MTNNKFLNEQYIEIKGR